MNNDETEDQLTKEMSEFFFADIQEGLEIIHQYDSQFLRRSLLRAIFAAIESVIYGMKTEILNRKNVAEPIFTTGEIALLEGKTFDINKKGEVIESAKFVEIKKNIRFIFKTYGKCYNTKLELEDDSIGWKYFVELVDKRNRITHPKTEQDLIITDKDIMKCRLVVSWFSEQFTNSINETTKTIKNEIEVLKAKLI